MAPRGSPGYNVSHLLFSVLHSLHHFRHKPSEVGQGPVGEDPALTASSTAWLFVTLNSSYRASCAIIRRPSPSHPRALNTPSSLLGLLVLDSTATSTEGAFHHPPHTHTPHLFLSRAFQESHLPFPGRHLPAAFQFPLRLLTYL